MGDLACDGLEAGGGGLFGRPEVISAKGGLIARAEAWSGVRSLGA